MPSSSRRSDTIRLEGVHKRFGAVTALRGASLVLKPGEVRALMGGNGSGKSTLAKILLGSVVADEIRVTDDGKPLATYGPAEAARLGVAGTYQDVSLLDDLSVIENLFLAEEPRRLGVLAAPSRRRRDATEALDRVLLSPKVLDKKVRELTLDERALAELAKVLLSEPRVLVMDELTASLRHEHVEMIGRLLRELSAEGVATLFVSHRLEEVEEFCDSATVLRNGELVLEADTISDYSMAEFLAAMTATSVAEAAMRTRQSGTVATGRPILEVKGFEPAGWSGSIDLTCHAGEIVGLAGLTGNGQSEVLRGIFGCQPAHAVQIRVDGDELHPRTVRGAMRHGVAFLSGDREKEMSFGVRSVEENLSVVGDLMRKRTSSGPLMERMKLVGHLRSRMRGLSGGNQQKVVIGRWLGLQPLVLLADDPTRGVDVGTRSEIHRLIRELAESGSTVLLTSSDDRELAEVCDRVYILYRGRVVTELTGDDIDEEKIAHASLDPVQLETAG